MIKLHEVCPHCNGDRQMWHPLWIEYFKLLPCQRDPEAFFGQHGYIPTEIPAFTETCPTCGGSGVVVTTYLPLEVSA